MHWYLLVCVYLAVHGGRRYSVISSHSSMSEGYWDWHGNGDQWQETRSGVPPSVSRLSDVVDVSDSDQQQSNPVLASRPSSAVPVREFSAVEKIGLGNPTYSSPHKASGSPQTASASSKFPEWSVSSPILSQNGAAHPSSQPMPHPSSQPMSHPSSLPMPHPSSLPMPHPSSQPMPHPSSQPMPHPSSQPMPHSSSQPMPHPSSQPMPHPSSLPMPHPSSQPMPHPSSLPMPHPSSQPMPHPSSQPMPHPSSQPVPYPSSQRMPHPSSQPMPHPSSQVLPPSLSSPLSRPSLVTFHQDIPLSSKVHSPQVHVQLEIDHTHTTPSRTAPISFATPTSFGSQDFGSIANTSSPSSTGLFGAVPRHSQAAPPSNLPRRHSHSAPPTSFQGEIRRHASQTAPPTSLSLASWPALPNPSSMAMPSSLSVGGANTLSCSSQEVNGLIPAAQVCGLTPPTSVHESDAKPPNYRRGHARHASLGNSITSFGHHRIHSRNRSLGSVTIGDMLAPPPAPSLTTHSYHRSMGNVSNSSPHGSKSNLLAHPAPPPINKEKGYDFAQHFNLFSQYTSNMALEYCIANTSSNDSFLAAGTCPPPPPVWCMDVHNKIIALGCKDGKVEVSEESTNE